MNVVVRLIKKCGEQRMWVNGRKAILLNRYTGGFRKFYSNSVLKFRVTANNTNSSVFTLLL